MRLVTKNIVAAIEPLFKDCNMRLVEISKHDVKVSPWNGQWSKNSVPDLIKILQVIQETDLIQTSYEVWRQVGYYECTDDITLNFNLNRDLLKKMK